MQTIIVSEINQEFLSEFSELCDKHNIHATIVNTVNTVSTVSSPSAIEQLDDLLNDFANSAKNLGV